MFCLGSTSLSLFAMEEEQREENSSLKKPIFDVNHTTVPFQSSASWTFLKKNWVPIISFTVFTSYCLYDRQSLPQALSWTKQCWHSLPKLVKGFCISGGIIGSLRTLYSLFQKQPLCNNPEHNQYVTLKMFEKYKQFLDEQLIFAQEMLQNPQNILNFLAHDSSKTAGVGGFGGQFPQLDSQKTDVSDNQLPSRKDLGTLFDSNNENKTKKRTAGKEENPKSPESEALD
jgi:hypothetical protein